MHIIILKAKIILSEYTGICKRDIGWIANIGHLGKQFQICFRQTEKEVLDIYNYVYNDIINAKTIGEVKEIIIKSKLKYPSKSREGIKYNREK